MPFLRILNALVAFLLLVSIANASPIFSLNTQADWQNAINSGQVTAVTTAYPALEYYATTTVDYYLTTPTLSALTNAQSGLGDGLQMEWGNDQIDINQVAAWEYTYGADPDLTNTILSLTVTPPAPLFGAPVILSVSLTLTDTMGDWMSWFWDVLPPGLGPSGLPMGVSSLISIDPTLHANQSNSTAFTESVGGFDHTIAISIIADELAINPGGLGANWSTFPPAPLSTGAPVWNYWGTLSVTAIPIPAAAWLFGSALVLLGWLRRRAT